MSMLSRAGIAILGAAMAAWTQTAPPLKINFAKDAPLAVVSAAPGESRSDARGGAMVLDLHTALTLRNTSPLRVRGVTLLVATQEFTPGGKGSVTVPSLDVPPGDTFPLRIDLRLLRPLMPGIGTMAEVTIDGVLFEDLSFYGPNKLNSRRQMTAWELEARRDRRHLRSILEAKGQEALRQELLSCLARLADHPSLDVHLVRRGRATAMAAPEREVRFAFLRMPDSPVEPVSGLARVAGSEARSPRIEVVNRSERPVRYFEIGWIIRDGTGREFLAGSVPASEHGLALAPGARGEVVQDAALRFSSKARPIMIEAMTGFVSQVEFGDGSIWIPGRAALSQPHLNSVLAPSPEEQRLTDLYRRKGLTALIDELKRFK
ncbi:MAG TPA: hypothetical protein VN428_18955 [Bryobacteraceae bacterium]|nr:hypothetical protein [Bryobacteraceae bacterium]